MNYLSDIQLLILLAAANGAPVFAKWLFGNRCAFPLDGNIKLGDGRPLFGASKTIRGILASIAVASVLAALLSMSVGIGFLVGSTAMAGDLCSSFTKRRLGLTPSSKATGLDQIPESLFPLLASRQALSLTLIDITAVTAIFFVGEIFLSKLLFRFKLRDRPY